MSDPFVAEIRIFPFPFAPKGWQMCNGQLVPVSQNTALFSLIGTTYGGDGVTTYALPDLEGNVPVCVTQVQNHTSPQLGNGLSEYDQGAFGGEQTHTLLDSENPVHSHNIVGGVAGQLATSSDPSGAIYKEGVVKLAENTAMASFSTKDPTVTLNPQALGVTGGGQPHNNMMPYLTLNFCIAITGIFPQRS
jgi:microcystin-dependent protein